MNRIQRKRTKDWKMPDNTKYVGRPTKWGNPFRVGVNYRNTAWLVCMYHDMPFEQFSKEKMQGITPKNINECIELYRLHLKTKIRMWGDAELQELKGKNLACFCLLSHPCHADVLLEELS
jgi:hypothetical protein